MARINVEDDLFTDPRFLELVTLLKNRAEALGSLIFAWRVAQKNYKDGGLISKEDWKKQKLNSKIIEVGLAVETENGIYLCGSNDQFAWLNQKSNAGKKSGESRRKNPQPRGPYKKTKISTDVNGIERTSTESNGAEPLLSSSLLSSSLLSSSLLNTVINNKSSNRFTEGSNTELNGLNGRSKNTDTFEKLEKVSTHDPSGHGEWAEIEAQQGLGLEPNTPPNERKRPVKRVKEPAPTTELFEAFNAAYTRRYGVGWPKSQQASSLLKQLLMRIGREDSLKVIDYYLTHNERFYVETQHALKIMLRDCEKLRTQVLTGKRVSSNQAKILEIEQGNKDAIAEHLRRRMSQFKQQSPTEPSDDENERGAEA